LRTPAVKETLRADFDLLPQLLAGPPPGATAEGEVDEEPIRDEEEPAPDPPRPPVDQLDLFG
jgi:hypothetical protein